jgi:hypothetical protein
MALTITQVTDMDKKKPNQVSPESTIWPAECFEQEPAKRGAGLGHARLEDGRQGSLLYVLC